MALLAYARIQGKGALIAHFQNSSLMNEDKRPILFHSDGQYQTDEQVLHAKRGSLSLDDLIVYKKKLS